jgi:hypothetical protein
MWTPSSCCNVRLTVSIPRDEDNTSFEVEWTPSHDLGTRTYRFTRQLEGAEAEKRHVFYFTDLAPAEYTVKVCVSRSIGKRRCTENIAYVQ